MNEGTRKVLTDLVQVGKIDAALARFAAEKKQLETKLEEKRRVIDEKQQSADRRKRVLEDRRGRYAKEEKIIRDERAKLVDRRKALDSLNNYKLQQAAQREIEHASKQLDLHEDGLIKTLGEIEAVEKEVSDLENELRTLRAAYEQEDKESREAISGIQGHEQEYRQRRAEAVQHIPPAMLTAYDRGRDRFPMDSIVPIKNGKNCSGCFMHLGPQVVVKIARGQELVRCPGCNRILYLEESEEE